MSWWGKKPQPKDEPLEENTDESSFLLPSADLNDTRFEGRWSGDPKLWEHYGPNGEFELLDASESLDFQEDLQNVNDRRPGSRRRR